MLCSRPVSSVTSCSPLGWNWYTAAWRVGVGKGCASLAGLKVHDKKCVLKLAEYSVLFMKYLAQNRVRALTCGWPGELVSEE